MQATVLDERVHEVSQSTDRPPPPPRLPPPEPVEEPEEVSTIPQMGDEGASSPTTLEPQAIDNEESGIPESPRVEEEGDALAEAKALRDYNRELLRLPP